MRLASSCTRDGLGDDRPRARLSCAPAALQLAACFSLLARAADRGQAAHALGAVALVQRLGDGELAGAPARLVALGRDGRALDLRCGRACRGLPRRSPLLPLRHLSATFGLTDRLEADFGGRGLADGAPRRACAPLRRRAGGASCSGVRRIAGSVTAGGRLGLAPAPRPSLRARAAPRPPIRARAWRSSSGAGARGALGLGQGALRAVLSGGSATKPGCAWRRFARMRLRLLDLGHAAAGAGREGALAS